MGLSRTMAKIKEARAVSAAQYQPPEEIPKGLMSEKKELKGITNVFE